MLTSDKRKVVCSSGIVALNEAEVVTAQDYYAFGMIMPNRTYSDSTGYRFGFNGMEKVDEMAGKDNNLDFGARIYDSRLGRWFSIDPLKEKFPSISPYTFAVNSPILVMDFDGQDLTVMGDLTEFTKFKSVIERYFDGLIKVERDLKSQKIHLIPNYKILEKAGLTQQDAQSIINNEMNKEGYKLLNKVISSEENVNVYLADINEMKKTVVIGHFQPGLQTIDMDDVNKLENMGVMKAISTLGHELEEAFQDQVINKNVSDNVKNMAPYFENIHNIAEKTQAKIEGVKEIKTYYKDPLDSNRDGIIRIEVKSFKNQTTNNDVQIGNGNVLQ